VKGTGYTLHSPVSPSLPLPCVTVCHHVSTGLYLTLLSDVANVLHTNQRSWACQHQNDIISCVCHSFTTIYYHKLPAVTYRPISHVTDRLRAQPLCLEHGNC